MVRAGCFAFRACLVSSAAPAQSPISFQGKTIMLVVGFPAGGGTDVAGRVIAANLGKHLPGNPNFVVENVPGAEGTTAMNLFFAQAKPDGTSLTMGSGSLGDPVHYRKPQVKYDPVKLKFVAGTGRGGSVLVINAAAEGHLRDKSQPAVIMGSTTGLPRSAMLMTAWGIEFLNWNAKWVIGYPGTNQLMIALERSEIEMTSTSNIPYVQKLVGAGKFRVLTQSGVRDGGEAVARGEFKDTPLFEDMMRGKITDPVQQKSFAYWRTLNDLDKWFALPPGTPDAIVQVYRDSFARMLKDPEFQQNATKISDDFEPRSGQDIENMIATLDSTTPEAIAFIDTMLKKQGLAAH